MRADGPVRGYSAGVGVEPDVRVGAIAGRTAARCSLASAAINPDGSFARFCDGFGGIWNAIPETDGANVHPPLLRRRWTDIHLRDTQPIGHRSRLDARARFGSELRPRSVAAGLALVAEAVA